MSTLAAACPGCGRPVASAASPRQPESPPVLPGILRSNLGEPGIVEAPRQRSGFPTAAVLVVALLWDDSAADTMGTAAALGCQVAGVHPGQDLSTALYNQMGAGTGRR